MLTYVIVQSSPLDISWGMAIAIAVHDWPLIGSWLQIFERSDATRALIVIMLAAALAALCLHGLSKQCRPPTLPRDHHGHR